MAVARGGDPAADLCGSWLPNPKRNPGDAPMAPKPPPRGGASRWNHASYTVIARRAEAPQAARGRAGLATAQGNATKVCSVPRSRPSASRFR